MCPLGWLPLDVLLLLFFAVECVCVCCSRDIFFFFPLSFPCCCSLKTVISRTSDEIPGRQWERRYISTWTGSDRAQYIVRSYHFPSYPWQRYVQAHLTSSPRKSQDDGKRGELCVSMWRVARVLCIPYVEYSVSSHREISFICCFCCRRLDGKVSRSTTTVQD